MSEVKEYTTYTLIVIVVLVFIYLLVKEMKAQTRIVEVRRDETGRIVEVVEKVI